MNEYALLINGSYVEIRHYDQKPDDIPHKNIVWCSVTREHGEPFEGQVDGNWIIRTIDPNDRQEIGRRVRSERNQKLSNCDWTQLHDAPINKEAWAAYRAELRNVPQQVGFPISIVWPVAPT